MARKRKATRKSTSRARSTRRSCICTNMSDLLGLDDIASLAAGRRRKRTSVLGASKTRKTGCKTWLTKHGTRMQGCFKNGRFRIVGKA